MHSIINAFNLTTLTAGDSYSQTTLAGETRKAPRSYESGKHLVALSSVRNA